MRMVRLISFSSFLSCFVLILCSFFIISSSSAYAMSIGVSPQALTINDAQHYAFIIANPNTQDLHVQIKTENKDYFSFHPPKATIRPGSFQKVIVEKKNKEKSGGTFEEKKEVMQRPKFIFVESYGTYNVLPAIGLKLIYEEEFDSLPNEKKELRKEGFFFYVVFLIILILLFCLIGVFVFWYKKKNAV